MLVTEIQNRIILRILNMFKKGLRFSKMSVSVARKSRLQGSRAAKHAQIGTENDWQKCMIDCWCN